MKVVSIIRDRGQLTIPDSIRKIVNWVTPMSAVSISVMKPDEIIIRPHTHKFDSNKVWENIRKSRSIKARSNLSALEILDKDRQNH